jgi:hypothetical protein
MENKDNFPFVICISHFPLLSLVTWTTQYLVGERRRSLSFVNTDPSVLPGLKKAVLLTGIRQHTGFISAKDAIPVARDETVNEIAQSSRYDSRDRRESLPDTFQLIARA